MKKQYTKIFDDKELDDVTDETIELTEEEQKELDETIKKINDSTTL